MDPLEDILRPGLLIESRYELHRPLARGGMGEVWEARHVTLGASVAIKFVTIPSEVAREEMLSRCQLEAHIASALSRRSPNVVQVTDHGIAFGTAYIVMELLAGEPLHQLFHRLGVCPPRLVVEIVDQIARALDIAHGEGIVHRDLKPSNVILMRAHDGSLLVKVLDFGVAKALTPHHLTGVRHATAKGRVMGTAEYMSPEQARGLGVDHRCDLWALAAVAYEALTGRPAFAGVTPRDTLVRVCTRSWLPPSTLAPALSLDTDDLFARAFAGRVEDRFAAASEFALALRGTVDNSDGTSPVDDRDGTSPVDEVDLEPSFPLVVSEPSRRIRALAPTEGVEVGPASPRGTNRLRVDDES